MISKVKPLHDRVLVERVEAVNKTAGGVLIPDNAKEKPAEGIVLAVGPGVTKEDGTKRPLDVQVNDRVLFAKHAANTELKIEGKVYLMMRELDIHAIIASDVTTN